MHCMCAMYMTSHERAFSRWAVNMQVDLSQEMKAQCVSDINARSRHRWSEQHRWSRRRCRVDTDGVDTHAVDNTDGVDTDGVDTHAVDNTDGVDTEGVDTHAVDTGTNGHDADGVDADGAATDSS